MDGNSQIEPSISWCFLLSVTTSMHMDNKGKTPVVSSMLIAYEEGSTMAGTVLQVHFYLVYSTSASVRKLYSLPIKTRWASRLSAFVCGQTSCTLKTFPFI